MTTTALIVLIVVILVAAVGIWYILRRHRSDQLRSRFGPEYQRAVRQFGGQPKAEEALLERQRRREKFHIHPLSAQERERFDGQWHAVQSRFVDDPPGSIREADRLVGDVMVARGYPMAEFDRRADDLSVDHPHVVSNFRAAHAIALRHAEGKASTEDLRQALVYYRDLFDELLEAHTAGTREIRR